jgi:hypothetical protein
VWPIGREGELMPTDRGPDRRGDRRRHADIARHITEQAVLAAALVWRTSDGGAPRNAAALRLRDAVDALLGLETSETGAARSTGILMGLAATGATLLFWYGPGSWLAILGAWLGSGAMATLAWRHWHDTETFTQHVYGPCRRCNSLPINCPTARRLAKREAGR